MEKRWIVAIKRVEAAGSTYNLTLEKLAKKALSEAN